MNKLNCFTLCRFFALLWAMTCVPGIASADAAEDFIHAVVMDNVSEVRLLLKQGINPNIKDKQTGNTALIVALHEQSMKAFDELINAPDINLDAAADNGNTGLMIAAYKGNLQALDTLLKKGAAVNRPGWTALHYAAASGNNHIAQILLDRGAEINARSRNLTTPLMIAAHEGYDMTVKFLLDLGADVTLKNETGMNAADYAKKLDRQDIIDLVNQHLNKAQKLRLSQK